jgi:hypothetical protein
LQITALGNCTQYVPYEWCSFDPAHQMVPGAPNYKPYDTPLNSLASCFFANGSWNMVRDRFHNTSDGPIAR